ncbi:MAG: hypothetical protein DWQ01_14805 [Planctomycetota bacterium]|nr:MAG: hypothetical protein DWQ01_14805 [Planctomycetota bacterium]
MIEACVGALRFGTIPGVPAGFASTRRHAPMKSTLGILFLACFAVAGSAQQETREGVLETDSVLDSLTLGGELRLRAEVRDPSGPVTGRQSSRTNTLRARVNIGFQVDEYLGGYFQFQESVAGTGTPANDVVHQAFLLAEQVLGDYTVQLGRYEMLFGDGRLVSPNDWFLLNNAFDGGTVAGDWENLRWQAFYTQAVVGQGGFAGANTDFHGIYGTWEVSPFLNIDTYILRRNDSSLGIDELTFGGRLDGEAYDNLFWSLEAAWQDGERGGLDVRAQAVALEAWYGLDGGHFLGLEWNLATGDDTPGDREDEAFAAPFGDSHRFNGLADVVAWTNLVDLAVRYRLEWSERWNFHTDLHFFQRETSLDTIYVGPGGAGIRPARSDDIGGELDVYLVGDLSENLFLTFGGAFFSAGNGVRNSDDQYWLFTQLGLKF